ncbi:hypothetical protein DIPPA_27935 [Diplonema papillatum]|nr:hypothetical protein DIPPA_27935 [Diplonema papillatum]
MVLPEVSNAIAGFHGGLSVRSSPHGSASGVFMNAASTARGGSSPGFGLAGVNYAVPNGQAFVPIPQTAQVFHPDEIRWLMSEPPYRNSPDDVVEDIWAYVMRSNTPNTTNSQRAASAVDTSQAGCTPPPARASSATSNWSHQPYPEVHADAATLRSSPAIPETPMVITPSSLLRSPTPQTIRPESSATNPPGRRLSPIQETTPRQPLSHHPQPSMPGLLQAGLRRLPVTLPTPQPHQPQNEFPDFVLPECLQSRLHAVPADNDEKKKLDVKEVVRRMKDGKTYASVKDDVLNHMRNEEICQSSWWRLCLELAELSKKENPMEAISWLCVVIGLAPARAIGWIELAKMQEDLDNVDTALALFKAGFITCQGNEKCQLTLRALRLLEMHVLPKNQKSATKLCRGLLGCATSAVLKTMEIEKSWKVLLEGALFESRQGNDDKAQAVLMHLATIVPKQGTVFLEAARIEEKTGNFIKAIDIVKQGLRLNPKFGPLVFMHIRLLEKAAWAEYEAARVQMGTDEKQTFAMFHRQPRSQPQLSEWLLGLSEMQEQERRVVNLAQIHEFVQEAKRCITTELVWKLYFEVAQAEERAGNYRASCSCYSSAFLHCLPNLQWKVLVGGARMELHRGNFAVAFNSLKAAFSKCQAAEGNQSRTLAVVKIELARYYEHVDQLSNARSTLEEAQKNDWRAALELINLELRSGDGATAAERVAKESLDKHEGVGRLWAMLTQLHSELGKTEAGDNRQALATFEKAKGHSGKAGEVWLEGARLHMDPLQPKLFDLAKAEEYLRLAMKYTPQYGDSFIEMIKLGLLQHGKQGTWLDTLSKQLMSADPNYGPLWQYCKQSPLMTCREVFVTAYEIVSLELRAFAPFFARVLRGTPPEANPLAKKVPWLFISAIPSLSFRQRNLRHLPLSFKRRLIFGCEPIVP